MQTNEEILIAREEEIKVDMEGASHVDEHHLVSNNFMLKRIPINIWNLLHLNVGYVFLQTSLLLALTFLKKHANLKEINFLINYHQHFPQHP